LNALGAAAPVLCLVTDRTASRAPLAEAVAAAVAGGVDWVQVREKDLEGAALLALCDELAAAARRARPGVRVVVNRRCDVALAAALDGVQLGFDAAPPAAARRLLGAAALVGASTHAPGELDAASRAAVSHLQLAPVFVPLSKVTGRAPAGLAALREAAARASVPVLAQGGVDASNAADCIRVGAAGVCVTGAILSAPDPGRAAAALRRALDTAPAAGGAGR
jgi:thiamine-phosphate pyrophosphorylase